MSYLFKQKLDLRELTGQVLPAKLIIVAEPEEYLLALYSYYLQKNNFEVIHCTQGIELLELIERHTPHLIIFNPRSYGGIKEAVKFVNNLIGAYPFVPIVTIGNDISTEDLRALMSSGIASHIDRRLSKPMDVVHVARSILEMQER